MCTLSIALFACAFAPPAGAQVAAGDSARGSGAAGLFVFDFDVTSGPSGESPSGRLVIDLPATGFRGESTSITCLAVSGNVATVAGPWTTNFAPNSFFKVTVTDTGPAGSNLDTFAANEYFAPQDCASPEPGFFGTQPLDRGDIVVHDAPPLPTTTSQCKEEGWRTFGVFKNQGDCVSFVATKGRNQPVP